MEAPQPKRSHEPRPGNWLRVEAASNAVIVRQTFLDRRSESPASMGIARTDATGLHPKPLDAAPKEDHSAHGAPAKP